MKMTRERKIYGAMLAVAAIALGVDKFVLGPPEEAQAAAGPEAPVAHVATKAPEARSETAVAAAADVPSMAALTRNVEQVSQKLRLDPMNCGDAFQPPAEWVKPAPKQQKVDSLAVFKSQHRLIAVLRSSRGGVAVIGNGTSRKSLRIGQQIDGFKLAAIGERSVTFAGDQGKVELQLAGETSTDVEVISAGGQ